MAMAPVESLPLADDGAEPVKEISLCCGTSWPEGLAGTPTFYLSEIKEWYGSRAHGTCSPSELRRRVRARAEQLRFASLDEGSKR